MVSGEINQSSQASAVNSLDLVERLQSFTSCGSMTFRFRSDPLHDSMLTHFLPKKLAEEVELDTEDPGEDGVVTLSTMTAAVGPLFVQWLYTRKLPSPDLEGNLAETIELYQRLGVFALSEGPKELTVALNTVIVEALKCQHFQMPDWRLSKAIVSLFRYLHLKDQYFDTIGPGDILEELGKLMKSAIEYREKFDDSILEGFVAEHPGACHTIFAGLTSWQAVWEGASNDAALRMNGRITRSYDEGEQVSWKHVHDVFHRATKSREYRWEIAGS